MVSAPPLTRHDPIARYAWIALLCGAVWINVATYQPPQAKAQGTDPGYTIVDATPTPSLPTPALPVPDALSLALSTPAPEPPAAIVDTLPVDQPPEALPTPDMTALIAEEQARATAAALAQAAQLQAIADVPAQQALNDPRQNGGNMAPQGCPFPIINGVCANGVLAKSVAETEFGSKSTADTSGAPAHGSKVKP